MIYCFNCGKELEDDVKVCPVCGAKIAEEAKAEVVEVVEAEQKPHVKKCFTVFGKIGYILGIVSMCIWWIPFFGIVGVETGAAGIVFSCLGKKDPELAAKTKKGLVLSIVATVLSFVFYIIWVVVLEAILIANM